MQVGQVSLVSPCQSTPGQLSCLWRALVPHGLLQVPVWSPPCALQDRQDPQRS